MNTIDEIRRYRLKMLVNEYGSSKALAEIIEKGPAQLSQWINASKDSKTGKPRVVSDDIAREIEKKTGKPRGWMDSIDEQPSFLQAQIENFKKGLAIGDKAAIDFFSAIKGGSQNPHAGKVPLISWVAAGTWVDPVDNYHVGDAEDWLPCPPNCRENCTFALTVRGPSMDDGSPAGYRDGEMIFVDGSKIEPVHNADVVVKNGGGHVTFKRLIQSGSTWYLKPLNPDWPEKIIEMGPGAHIVGRVMFSGRIR